MSSDYMSGSLLRMSSGETQQASLLHPKTTADRPGERQATEPVPPRDRIDSWRIGTVVSSPDPVLAEAVASAVDFIWIDLEHSALTVRDAQTLAIAAKAGGAMSFVRVPRADSAVVGAVLDMGVDGIVAPKVESAAQASAVVDALRYPPAGSRGFAPRRGTRGALGTDRGAGLGRPLCVVQIETRSGVEHAEAIAGSEGVDALVVGTADLSFDLGSPLDMDGEALKRAIEVVGQAARRHAMDWGVAIGALTEWVSTLAQQGASLMVFSSDLGLYTRAIAQGADAARAVGDGVSA